MEKRRRKKRESVLVQMVAPGKRWFITLLREGLLGSNWVGDFCLFLAGGDEVKSGQFAITIPLYSLDSCFAAEDEYLYPEYTMRIQLFISFEDDLLHFHRIEDLVGLHGSREGHDSFGHESDFSLAK